MNFHAMSTEELEQLLAGHDCRLGWTDDACNCGALRMELRMRARVIRNIQELEKIWKTSTK